MLQIRFHRNTHKIILLYGEDIREIARLTTRAEARAINLPARCRRRFALDIVKRHNVHLHTSSIRRMIHLAPENLC